MPESRPALTDNLKESQMKISFKDGFKAGLGLIAAQVVAGIIAACALGMFLVVVAMLAK